MKIVSPFNFSNFHLQEPHTLVDVWPEYQDRWQQHRKDFAAWSKPAASYTHVDCTGATNPSHIISDKLLESCFSLQGWLIPPKLYTGYLTVTPASSKSPQCFWYSVPNATFLRLNLQVQYKHPLMRSLQTIHSEHIKCALRPIHLEFSSTL